MTTKEVQKARERFLTDGEPDDNVRAAILTSWRRSKAFSVRNDRLTMPFIREPNLDSPLIRAASPVLQQLADGLAAEPVSVILTSADGVVLTRISPSHRLERTLDAVNLAPGYSYAEEFVGTNGIGTAIETRSPTLVIGAEHYADCLGQLACAGVPIIHPVSGAVAGVLDLTGWVEDGGPLLATLARSASHQIEGRLLEDASAAQMTLLNAYLAACRRAPQLGILALGDDVMLMNRRLRWALDVEDQAALFEHAIDSLHVRASGSLVCTLPSGQTVRLTRAGVPEAGTHPDTALFSVHLNDKPAFLALPRHPQSRPLPGLVGDSASWRHSCDEISRCVSAGQWVAVSGEPGSGRCAALAAAVAHLNPGRAARVLSAADFAEGGNGAELLDQALGEENFQIIVRDLDELTEEQLSTVADCVHGREHGGWIGATISGTAHDSSLGALLLPFFGQTVSVPALRHRIEDLIDLVPHLLRQLSRGAEVSLSPDALRQLRKYSWPGNVAQLRDVLREVVQRQRTGVVGVHQLPPMCRSVSRHALTQIEALERDAIVRSLETHGGNKKAAATALGISRATIYRKIREFGISL